MSTFSPSQTRLWFPVEIVEQIIFDAWSSSMSSEERVDLFKSLSLVNRSWLNIFIRTALRDVHLTDSHYADEYVRLLRERATCERDDDYLLDKASATANSVCRSLTFYMDGSRRRTDVPNAEPSVRLFSHGDRSSDIISNTLYMIDRLNYIRNLRRVTIEYHDWGFDDVFDQLRLISLPSQVTHLELKYSFSPILETAAELVRARHDRKICTSWSLTHVRSLTITGAPLSFVLSMMDMCPNLETLDVDGTFALVGLAPLPLSVRTLRVGAAYSSSPIHGGGRDLMAALEHGLFPESTGRITFAAPRSSRCNCRRRSPVRKGVGVDFVKDL